MFDGTGKPMLHWSICLSTTNISLDNESELSQGIEIFVGLIDIETVIYVRSMRHGRNENLNCHIKMLQLCSIWINIA